MLRNRTVIAIFQIALVMTVSLFTLSTALAAPAEEKRLGLGAILGEPTGLSANYLLGKNNAIDFSIGWNVSGDNNFNLHSDYLWYRHGLLKPSSGSMAVYFGVGGRMELRENASDNYGARAPIGVSYRFADPQALEVFGEIVPILDLSPSTEFDINIGVGVRYYFL